MLSGHLERHQPAVAARHRRREREILVGAQLLQSITESDRIVHYADDDSPVRYRSALYYVRLVCDDRCEVQVFAVAVDGVDASPELLADINDVNTRIRFARVFHVRGQVLVEADLVGEDMAPSSFFTTCETIAHITDQTGSELAAKHGGHTVFDDAKGAGYLPAGTAVGSFL